MNRELKTHWNTVYDTKPIDGVSWYQQKPEKSLELIHQFMPANNHPTVIDVGGGTSTLVDCLLTDGYDSLVILDIAESALAQTRQRLGDTARKVSWMVTDITMVDMPADTYDLWHDRAVFHFLIRPEDQLKYVRLVDKSLKPGGILVMSTFAPDGPEKCSNLSVNRYACDDLWQILGQKFKLVHSDREVHQTPFQTQQTFSYCVFEKL